MTPGKTARSSKDIPFVTTRRAMGPPGCIGSLYDGYEDRVLGDLSVNKKEISCQTLKSRKCMITNGSNDQSENILKTVGVEHELRLTALLNLAEREGIAGIIDYAFPIDEYTRFFYCSYLDREEHISDDSELVKTFGTPRILRTDATHIITGIRTGIDVIVVLQLPNNIETAEVIDAILHQLRTFLLNNDNIFKLSSQEADLLGTIMHTEIYSNISDLKYQRTILDIVRYIVQMTNGIINHPVLYTLRPIEWLYSHYTKKIAIYTPLPSELSDEIEQYVLQLKDEIKQLKASINGDLKEFLCGHLKERLSSLQKQCSVINKKYKDEVERLSKLVIDVRSGRVQVQTIVDKALKDNERLLTKNSIHDFTRNFNNLDQKGRLIAALTKQKFQYYNVADYDIDRTDNERTIERKLVRDDQLDFIICSNDVLNGTRPGQMTKLCDDMVNERKHNPNLRLIYADFSYCSFELQSMMTLPSSNYINGNNKPKQKGTSSFRELQMSVPLHTTAQTFVSPATKAPTIIPLSEKAQTLFPSSGKPQFTIPSSTGSETPIVSSVKEQYIIPSSKETQATVSSLAKPHSTVLSSTRSETPVVPSIKAQTTVPSSKGTQATFAFLERPQSTVPTSEKTQTIVPFHKEAQTTAPFITKIDTSTALPTTSSDNEIINILLLGETGVGKSTFINAFANYLTFNTLQQAQSNKPVVLIPVSFLVTVGDNFEEHTVKFGGVDTSNNEDFDHPGQSVTQHCKSYVFQPNVKIGKKLRIIDTPGFGDTRGLDQDDRNMQHILEYINNLSHLNAICFLLKPNASRLNIFFRSCFTQLFSLLGSDARNNIIFCFTNARSTFYTPGDTAPLLKQMLTALPVADVPFKKENTFCFDSEAFRYLVALQNGIQFNQVEKHEYETSWSTSVTQSHSLIDYILTPLPAYRMDGEYQSITHAQFEMLHMVRPVLETMRNILRNLILYKINSSKASIELRPKVVDHPAVVCLACKSELTQIGNFWIARDIPHKIEKNCHTCQCPHNQHISIDYILDYEFLDNSSKYDHTQMIEMLNRVCYTSAEFSYFLIHIARFSNDDLYMAGLSRMIRQETDICVGQKTNSVNSELVKRLKELKRNYEQWMTEMKWNKELHNLPAIYSRIKYIREHPLIREQMSAVQKAQMMMMKHSEYEVPKN